jgi:hypothetical protein
MNIAQAGEIRDRKVYASFDISVLLRVISAAGWIRNGAIRNFPCSPAMTERKRFPAMVARQSLQDYERNSTLTLARNAARENGFSRKWKPGELAFGP